MILFEAGQGDPACEKFRITQVFARDVAMAAGDFIGFEWFVVAQGIAGLQAAFNPPFVGFHHAFGINGSLAQQFARVVEFFLAPQ